MDTLEAAVAEATAIWASAGLRLTWTFWPDPVDLTTAGMVIVVVLPALRQPSGASSIPSKEPAMPVLGQIPFGENGPAHLIKVFFEAITSLVLTGSYLGKPISTLPDLIQRTRLGRGLGRVVAHEVGHWLVGRGHVQDGLMKRSFDDRDLVQLSVPRLPNGWTSFGSGSR
jgi:hypothetical protein